MLYIHRWFCAKCTHWSSFAAIRHHRYCESRLDCRFKLTLVCSVGCSVIQMHCRLSRLTAEQRLFYISLCVKMLQMHLFSQTQPRRNGHLTLKNKEHTGCIGHKMIPYINIQCSQRVTHALSSVQRYWDYMLLCLNCIAQVSILSCPNRFWKLKGKNVSANRMIGQQQ